MFYLKLNLKALREQHGYTQKELAEKLNVHVDTVHSWEHQKSIPPTERLVDLALLFHVPVSTLIGYPVKETMCIDGLSSAQLCIIRPLLATLKKLQLPSKPTISAQEQRKILSGIFELLNNG